MFVHTHTHTWALTTVYIITRTIVQVRQQEAEIIQLKQSNIQIRTSGTGMPVPHIGRASVPTLPTQPAVVQGTVQELEQRREVRERERKRESWHTLCVCV